MGRGVGVFLACCVLAVLLNPPAKYVPPKDCWEKQVQAKPDSLTSSVLLAMERLSIHLFCAISNLLINSFFPAAQPHPSPSPKPLQGPSPLLRGVVLRRWKEGIWGKKIAWGGVGVQGEEKQGKRGCTRKRGV